MNIVIVDYGAGNIGSILNIMNRLGVKASFKKNILDIEKSDKIILPGVGAFDFGMKQLKNSGLISILEKKIFQDKVPVLGICLGMQMLFDKSEEGVESGLGWLKGRCQKFSFSNESEKQKLPHMGWNIAKPLHSDSLFEDLEMDSRFYFVHSYHVICDDENDILSKTNYGYTFTSAVRRENIYGVQFHPEKSHRYGMALLKNFVEHT